MQKTAFITGISGQDGAYLASFLLNRGYAVHGGMRRTSTGSIDRLKELNVSHDVIIHDFELSEITNMQRVLNEVCPDEIYNLAAQSFVGTSFEQPIYTSNIDGLGPLRVLEIIRTQKSKTKFYQASTSEMFGRVQSDPQDEETAFYPRSSYGISKLFAHWSTVNYRQAYDIFACSGILFNHESPLRGREFVTRKITLGLAKIKHGKQDVLELGNLDAKRDWGFAGDYVAGMWAMLQAEKPDDFVLATGVAHTVRSFVEVAANRLGMEIAWEGTGIQERGIEVGSGRAVVAISPRFFRPAEVDVLRGSSLKAEELLNWRPRVSFEELVSLMAEADERRVRDGQRLD